jgi:uncharacterized membrane protein YbhN (UPF0104 family)
VTRTAPSAASAARSVRRRRLLRAVVALAVVIVVFVGILPQIADVGDVWAAVRTLTWRESLSLLAAAGWNLLTYVFLVVASLPGLTGRRAFLVTQASTAVANTVPAGAAVGLALSYRLLTGWGYPPAATTLSVLVTGMWNTFAKLALPVLALACLALTGESSTGRVVTGLVGIAVLLVAVGAAALALSADRLAGRVGDRAARLAGGPLRLLRRPAPTGWGAAAMRFRGRTIGLLRRRWAALTAATLLSHASLFLVLLLSLRHVGVAEDEVSWAAALAAFAFVRLISALPITPGGVGVVELGLTAALVAAGGEEAPVVAAVLVYRGLTYLLPIPVGGLAYLAWRAVGRRGGP